MGGGSFPIRKIMLRFFGKGKALRAPISRTKAQHFFPKIGWGGGVRGRLEVFRKFIEFGTDSLPLLGVGGSSFFLLNEYFYELNPRKNPVLNIVFELNPRKKNSFEYFF